MSRPRKGPRLYLRAGRADRAAVYVILDGAREIGTGCGADRAAEAEAALARYLAQKYTPPRPAGQARLDDILIADVVAAYLAGHASTTASAEFIAHTAAPVLAWWGARTLADVKGQACRDYVQWRTSQPVANTARPRRDGSVPTQRMTSAATARHDLKTLRAAINHWHREHGPLTSIPAVTLPSPSPPRERWLTRAEAAALVRAARRTRQAGHVARLALIGLYTGTRSQAMLRLKWLPSTDGGWVDIDGGVIHRRARGAHESRKRQPPARIPDRLLPHLVRWRQADLAAGIVHVVHYGGRPVGKLRRSWASARAAAGLGPDVVPHTLRHTAATWLMQGGVDLYEAAGFLGMSAEMLLEVYGHHHPDFQSGAAKAQRGRKRTAREHVPAPAQEMPKEPSENDGNSRPAAAANAMKRRGNP